MIEADQEIDEAKKNNFIFALHAALLQLPETFTRFDLLTSIVKLSYTGPLTRNVIL